MRYAIIALLTHFLRMPGGPRFEHSRTWEFTLLHLRRVSTLQFGRGGSGHPSGSRLLKTSLQSGQAKQDRSMRNTCAPVQQKWRGVRCPTMPSRKG